MCSAASAIVDAFGSAGNGVHSNGRQEHHDLPCLLPTWLPRVAHDGYGCLRLFSYASRLTTVWFKSGGGGGDTTSSKGLVLGCNVEIVTPVDVAPLNNLTGSTSRYGAPVSSLGAAGSFCIHRQLSTAALPFDAAEANVGRVLAPLPSAFAALAEFLPSPSLDAPGDGVEVPPQNFDDGSRRGAGPGLVRTLDAMSFVGLDGDTQRRVLEVSGVVVALAAGAPLRVSADLLGIRDEQLHSALQAAASASSVHSMAAALDLARWIHRNLFRFLLDTFNSAMAPSGMTVSREDLPRIQVLDVLGFERSEVSASGALRKGLGDLFRNYAAERLQAAFGGLNVQAEQEAMLTADPPSQRCLDLLMDGPQSLIAHVTGAIEAGDLYAEVETFTAESRDRNADVALVAHWKVVHRLNSYFSGATPEEALSSSEASADFVVKHDAGTMNVIYSAEGFASYRRGIKLHPVVKKALASSTDSAVVQHLVAADNAESAETGFAPFDTFVASLRPAQASSSTKDEENDDRQNTTEAVFVHCLRPNDPELGSSADAAEQLSGATASIRPLTILRQLRELGTLAAFQAYRSGLPESLPMTSLVMDFDFLNTDEPNGIGSAAHVVAMSPLALRSCAVKILNSEAVIASLGANKTNSCWRLGAKTVHLRAGATETLVAMRTSWLAHSATKIQRWCVTIIQCQVTVDLTMELTWPFCIPAASFVCQF